MKSKFAVARITRISEQLYAVARICFLSGSSLEEYEFGWRRAIIQTALESVGFNQVRAARVLRLHRNTMSRAIQECGLTEWLSEKKCGKQRFPLSGKPREATKAL